MALDYSIIGERLKKARIDNNLTQEKLAEKLDVSIAFLSRIERGSSHIINYLEVVDFSNTKVIVRYRDGTTIIEGENLVVSKMLDDELLITGKLKVLKYN